MKKRVLSLLMAVIMLVAALPLAVLPVLAAGPVYKGDIYTAEDYNALYVEDGRLMMIDFYTLNPLWDPEGTKLAEVSTPAALDPANKQSWFYQFSVSQTVNGNSHYYNVQFNVPQNCNNACSYSTATGACTASWHDPNGLHQKANFTVGAGHIDLLDNLMPDNLLNCNNVPAHNNGFTYQLVFKPGDATGSKSFFRVNNVILYSWTGTGSPYSLTAVAEANKTSTGLSSSVDATKDAVHTLNYMKAPVVAEAGTHTYSAAFDLGAASTATITAPTASNATHIGYSKSADMSLYAIRSYDRMLTDAERLQNHIADLFKYYKIDITLYKELSDTDKAAVRESVKSFALPATDDVDAIKQTKADLQAALDAAAQPLYYSVPVDATALATHIYALGAKHGLDLSDFQSVRTLPVGYLANTAAAMNAISVEDDSITGEAVQTALDEAIEADMAAIYAEGTMTADEYNALYVNRGDPIFIDFFTANKYWDPDSTLTLDGDYGLKTDNAFVPFIRSTEVVGRTVYLGAAIPPNDRNPLIDESNPDLGRKYSFCAVSLHNGFVAFDQRAGDGTKSAESYLHLNGPTANLQNYTVQYVLNPNNGTSSTAFIFNNLRLYTVKTDQGLLLGNTTSTDFDTAQVVATKWSERVYMTNTKVTDLTLTVDRAGADYNTTISLEMFLDAESKATASIVDGYKKADGMNATNLIGYGSTGVFDMSLYAWRFYDVTLTGAEIAQNHFADIAKYFRLNLVNFNTLSDETLAALYDAFLALDLQNSTRAQAQAIYLSIAMPELKASYAEKLVDNPNAEQLLQNRLWQVAAEYFLDIATVEQVVTAERAMTYVYDTVTMAKLDGKNTIEAQVYLEKAAHDAYYYEGYRIAGDDARDAFLDLAKANQLSIEEAMAIPPADLAPLYAACNTGMSKQELQAAVYEKTAEILVAEGYETLTEADYNALYVTTGLYFALDFFSLNEFWDVDGSNLAEKSTLEALYFNEGSANNKQTWLKNFLRTDGEHGIHAYSPPYKATANCGTTCTAAHHDHTATGDFQRVPFTPKAGYVSFVRPLIYLNDAIPTTGQLPQHYLEMSGFGNTLPATALSHQLIFKANSLNSGSFLQLHGTGFYVYAEGNIVQITKLGASSNPALSSRPELVKGQINDFLFGYENNGGKNTYGVAANGSDYVTTDIASPTVNANNLLGFSSTTDMDLYAMRSYDHVLSAEEIAQNHFADLAKYYKLDITAYLNFLTEDQKANVRTRLADFDIGGDASVRAAVTAAYLNLLEELYYSAYADMPLHDVVLAAQQNPAILNALSAEKIATLTDAFTWLDLNYAWSGQVVRSVWDDALTSLWPDVELPVEATFTQEQYNKHYARIDRLVNWFDFFAADPSYQQYLDPYNFDGTETEYEQHYFKPGEELPFVKAGWLGMRNEARTGGFYPSERVFGDGYISLKNPVYSNLSFDAPTAPLRDNAMPETDRLAYSDKTYEFVFSNFVGGGSVFMMDSIRTNIYQSWSGDELELRGVNEHKLYINDTGAVVGGYLSNHTTVPTASFGSPAIGHTLYMTLDKQEKTENGYYLVFKGADGKYTSIEEITAEQAAAFAPGADLTVNAQFVSVTDTAALAASGLAQDGLTAEIYILRHLGRHTYTLGMDLQQYTTGTLINHGSYTDSLGSGATMHLYAIRSYDVVLTEDEMQQNHFIDLAKFYSLDITLYETMTEAQKQRLYDEMAPYYLADDAAAVKTAYKTALVEAIYGAENLGADVRAFLEQAAQLNIDTRLIMQMPEGIRADVISAWSGFAGTGTDEKILCGLLDEKLALYTDELLAQSAIQWMGYEVLLSELVENGVTYNAGIRAQFKFNKEAIELLISRGYTVKVGAKATLLENGAAIERCVYENGEWKPYYEAGDRADYDRFYVTITFPSTMTDEKKLQAYAADFNYQGFIFLEKDGQTQELYTDMTAENFQDAVSLRALYKHALENRLVNAPIVGQIVNTGYTASYLTDLKLRGVNIDQYTILYTEAYGLANAQKLQQEIATLTGILLPVVAMGTQAAPIYASTLSEYAICLTDPSFDTDLANWRATGEGTAATLNIGNIIYLAMKDNATDADAAINWFMGILGAGSFEDGLQHN